MVLVRDYDVVVDIEQASDARLCAMLADLRADLRHLREARWLGSEFERAEIEEAIADIEHELSLRPVTADNVVERLRAVLDRCLEEKEE